MDAVLWFGRGKRVLTIGSVHLDTIALSEAGAQDSRITHIGNITHSVGGSAYNVAANLASHHGKSIREAAIYTILPQHSVLTEIIKYKIDAAGVSSRFVRLYKAFNNQPVRGGGYVGILDNDRLIRHAVVDAAMYGANIFQDRGEASHLEAAIAWADALVLDSDLAVATVNRLCDHARDHGKPLFVCVGSPEAGVRSWIGGHDENLATCIGGRLLVLCRMLEHLNVAAAEIAAFHQFVESGDPSASFDITALCRHLKTSHLVCCNVRKSNGFGLLAAGGRPYKCFFETPEAVRTRVQEGNSAGVVDGALAGFIQSYARLAMAGRAGNGELLSQATQKLFNTNIVDFAEHVSESKGATPGSVISFEEEARQQSGLAKLWRLTKIAFDVLPVFRYIFSLGALIIAMWLVENAIGVLEYFGYQLPFLDHVWIRTILRR
jgi:sugar/nucleoside kinase (ribokinase family)